MHLTLRFLGSNTNCKVSPDAYLRHKNHQKPLWNRLRLGATLFSTSSGFRCPLVRQHGTQDFEKTLHHSSGGHPRAAQQRCQTAQEPCKTAVNSQPKRTRPPRASKISTITPKVDRVPLRATFLEPTWLHLSPFTQLVCNFFTCAVVVRSFAALFDTCATDLAPCQYMCDSLTLLASDPRYMREGERSCKAGSLSPSALIGMKPVRR